MTIFHTGGNHRTPCRELKSGLIVFRSSSSGNIDMNAATMLPPDVPEMTCGRRPS
jgi:hypothetical protein